MNLRSATLQMTGLRTPSRVRAIPSLRRRLEITIVGDQPETVIIRHIVPNVGTPVEAPRQIQNRRL
jgi:hypothetical protein